MHNLDKINVVGMTFSEIREPVLWESNSHETCNNIVNVDVLLDIALIAFKEVYREDIFCIHFRTEMLDLIN